ncbi:MAG: hypothetical protein A3I63_02845 [Betaproteobacteria bacterium RIFCSPLOWO2_02_FULL_66_14]|nr:MAG: hypothetical protein A3I63_02845 [Betaproteobacteria bacterium RIFCSPLOWO2_02_FULL_66_14]
MTPKPTAKPWYREPWPWILMAGPAAVVVAGAVTLWLAMANADGLVADDYYRRGLAINRDLGLQRRALEQGIRAQVTRADGVLRVELAGAAPDALFVQLVHPTRSGFDQRLRLARTPGGAYEAQLPALPAGRWRLVVEDSRGEWKIVKEDL